MANNKKDASPKKNTPPTKKHRTFAEWTQKKASLFVDRLIESSGLKTQAALEEDLGYTGNRISNLRNPKSSVRIPDADDMLIYAKKYGCSIDYLLGIEEDSLHSPDKETLADFAKYLFYLCDGEDIEVDAENASITFKNEHIKEFICEWAEARQMPQKFIFNGDKFYDEWKENKILHEGKFYIKRWGYECTWDIAEKVRKKLQDDIDKYKASPDKNFKTSLNRKDIEIMHDTFREDYVGDIYDFYLKHTQS